MYFAKLSPLQKSEIRYTEVFKQDLGNIEKCNPFPARPWYNAPYITIAFNANEAVESHNRVVADPKIITLYTDGSGINQRIGAAAVEIFTPFPRAVPSAAKVRATYLGYDTNFTVYSGELQGLKMALEMAMEDNSNRHVFIFTDNQAAIRAVEDPRNQSGQYILQSLVARLELLKKHIHIHWIPSHIGIPANEAADRAAKEATGWRENGIPSAPLADFQGNPTLIAAATTQVRHKTKKQWVNAWHEGTTGRKKS